MELMLIEQAGRWSNFPYYSTQHVHVSSMCLIAIRSGTRSKVGMSSPGSRGGKSRHPPRAAVSGEPKS
ncbi:hypothetical protein EVAR_35784_1 [Eumeta japonica]|uniref:Uncharacterized protein n=1 Tax=Eumeta variegata TaxID=151549 RepID=A0A4C1WR46_EUMVA|nr:hypothetical protein EVAR_35784_1 [Eumeta japonica]